MKKFFILGLFITALILPMATSAGIRSAAEPPFEHSIDPKKNLKDLQRLYQEIPNINDKEAMLKYIKKRLKIVQKVDMTPEQIASPQSVSIIDTKEMEKKQEETLSAYEKIYKESMQRAEQNTPLNADVKLDGTFYEVVHPQNNMEGFVPDFPYVTIKLSDTREIMAPAEEHIAYLLTTIKVETNGTLRVTEEFIFVSNNEGFPEGFFRILPKYSQTPTGKKRRIDLTLNSVTVNGEEHPYKVTEVGNYLYIEPKQALDLPTGIYTYKFNYLIDRAIWFNDNFDEFYWDISGRTLRNVVGSANAVVSLPIGQKLLGQNAVAITKQGLNSDRITIADIEENTVAFADTEALAVGDDIHLFLNLEKGTIYTPDLSKKYFWFIQDYGAILFALIALLAIYLSYRTSLKQIRLNRDKTKAKLTKTPAIFRLINANVFDIRSLIAEILDLAAKNIIELKEENQTATFIKKTDNLKKLSKSTIKLLHTLFPNGETALPATASSKLKLERAYKYLRRMTYRKYQLYSFKLNGMYLLCSFAMLICGIFASAATAINPTHTFWIIFSCTALILPYAFLCIVKFKKKWLSILVKCIAGISILYIAAFMAIYTSYLYAALIIISVCLILHYYQEFSRRSGLLRNKIKETEEYKSYLQKNPELAASARDFNTKVPYIYAFSLENKFKEAKIFELIRQYETLLNSDMKG